MIVSGKVLLQIMPDSVGKLDNNFCFLVELKFIQ